MASTYQHKLTIKPNETLDDDYINYINYIASHHKNQSILIEVINTKKLNVAL